MIIRGLFMMRCMAIWYTTTWLWPAAVVINLKKVNHMIHDIILARRKLKKRSSINDDEDTSNIIRQQECCSLTRSHFYNLFITSLAFCLATWLFMLSLLMTQSNRTWDRFIGRLIEDRRGEEINVYNI